jgi:O-methyltransferase
MKQKVFIFGAGDKGKALLDDVKQKFDVIGFIDNDPKRQEKFIDKYPVYSPDKILSYNYDGIVLATVTYLNTMNEQLIKMGVDPYKIIKDFCENTVKRRIDFLEDLRELFNEKSMAGSLAEGGVFQGEFAYEINRIFPEKPLYLFDTFSGFDSRDIAVEEKNDFSHYDGSYLNLTSEEYVLKRLLHPEQAIIKKGYFPESVQCGVGGG